MIWNINPTITTLGPLTLSWYGLLFAGGFLVGVNIMQWIYRREDRNVAELDTLLWFVLGGTLIGMRLVHCLFYDPQYFLAHPFEILQIWKGGYASHGGAIGVLLGVYWYCRGPDRPKYLWLLDRLAIAAVLTGAFIRIGNFFNSEIIGVPTDSVFGVTFQRVDLLSRHPVQLYEAAAYLAIFATMLWLYRSKRVTTDGALTGWYLTLVFASRFALEFFKTPQAAFEVGNVISVGQYLSVPFVIAGLILLVRARPAHLGVVKVGE
jgi:phosphatidylglycerol---prolipoprotein diacylglyceryl transferase